ncbi:beta-lactamase [Endozoicomonas sp. SM1973]|uniref:Beta-lactamase n=1 Tax=Spartinivicinus marinus TaxID=2994442 RepID=A0A853I884_9GAMM|nr:class C beta-lactamase [Spartinivicinus marinus]MCX4024679.1 beta-lactamase [Spartinivicinus marinus]NYZ66294.1 beta-lactamase [Spartinivicinus marinus]
MQTILRKTLICSAISFIVNTAAYAQTTQKSQSLKLIVDKQAHMLMDKYQIPGMAIGITIDGNRHYFNYGLANKATKQKITENTLFELGSVSKTFAATLASYAEIKGKLSMQDKASKYLPTLGNSPIGNTSLLQLATYTAGGLPLQFPAKVDSSEKMLAYYQSWQPEFTPGSKRQYSNPSIGLFGYLAALSMGTPYETLVENKLFSALGMSSSYINVPKEKLKDYAYGYSKSGEAVRVNPGMLDSEAYGVKSTTEDMLRYIEANMGMIPLEADINKALQNTHIGYYKASTLTQALGWETYPYPVKLNTLLAGNSVETILEAKPTKPFKSPQPANDNVFINKTGSTGGFGAYVSYIPAEKTGIVILANKFYPNTERVKAAFKLFKAVKAD